MNILHCDICEKRIKKSAIVLAAGYVDTHKGRELDSDLRDRALDTFDLCKRCASRVDLLRLVKGRRSS